MNELEQQIAGILAPMLPEPVSLASDTDLLADLALESAQLLEFVMEVEDHFDIIIEQSRLSDVRTLGELAAVVSTLR